MVSWILSSYDSSFFLPKLFFQFQKKHEDFLVVRRTILDVANDAVLIDDHGPSSEPVRGAIRTEGRRWGVGPILYPHPGQHIGNERKLQIHTFGKVLVRYGIIHADAQDLGVQALIEIKVSIVRLHLSRSDRGEGGWKEGHHEVMLPIVVLVVIHEAVLG